ncbi:MAG: hypothetical protein EOO77_20030 [Oxalobacteraceae bacterium]|nr:MAG: hypothetical protein EOO77_20030 [Oxalobacteraceae bacterium]
MIDWRMPASRPEEGSGQLDDFATHVRILSWFFDDPSPLCPFSVHRMALIGKELGKEVGEWFGPSTAAGALKLVYQLSGLWLVPGADNQDTGKLVPTLRNLGGLCYR